MDISTETAKLSLHKATASPSAAKQIEDENARPVADLLFGSIAGMVGMLFQFPWDTIKVRLQSQPLSKDGYGTLFTGPLDCFRQALRNDGFMNLYKGLSAPLVGSMIENSVLFLAFNRIQTMIRRHTNTDPDVPLSLGQLALSGALSGALVSFVLTPVELVKCKLQVQDVLGSSHPQGTTYAGPISVLTRTIKQHGLLGLYEGHVGTFLREAGGGAAWFGAYELIIRECIAWSDNPAIKTKEDLSPWHIMGAGAVAGMSYNATLFPADSVKSRQQTTEGGTSFSTVARNLYRSEGIKGFYRGFGITVARSAPTSALIFATYEYLSRHVPLNM